MGITIRKIQMDDSKEIKVAYVEDEPSIAQLLASGLGLFGIKVHPIYMSAEALLDDKDQPALAEADILFFDIRLPGRNGVELATELREMGETRPFVLVSAWPAPPDSKLNAINARFLAKPFDFADVVKTIQDLTDS